MELTYYIEKTAGYEPFLTYKIPENMHNDEKYARQLCEFFVTGHKEYELQSNEMKGSEEILIVKEKGPARRFSDEPSYKGRGIFLEFRQYNSTGDMPLLHVQALNSHWDVMRYLLKDVVEIPRQGQFLRDSAEIDEDRSVYVMYVGEKI
ncbi:RNA helicase [Fictibacillus nanhaiensis]|uniref:RNA helicase n=1 Tax=Fictibacillus nanhaiensis TaxID=742169 RepID=UPI0023EEA2BF|nr:RNA helicase [Fictibacillus nanhaiensis]